MKKLIYISLILLFASCTGSKSIFNKESKTNQTEKVTTINDSTSNVETNLPIKDRIVVNVPETDNKEVMKMFEALMVQLNTSKTSGTNSYKSTYDKDTRQFIIDFMVAQTRNQTTNTNSDTSTEKTFEETVTENTKKVIKLVPLWLWIVIGLYFLPQILLRVNMIINPIAGVLGTLRNATKQ